MICPRKYRPSPGKETTPAGKVPKSSQSKAGKKPCCAQSLSLGLPSSSTYLQLASLFLLDNFFLIRVFGGWPCSPQGEGVQLIRATNWCGAGRVPVVFNSEGG